MSRGTHCTSRVHWLLLSCDLCRCPSCSPFCRGTACSGSSGRIWIILYFLNPEISFLNLLPSPITHRPKGEHGVFRVTSGQWHCHLHWAAASLVPPVFLVLGCCFEGAHESEGSQGCQQGSWTVLTCWWGP